MRHKWKLVLVRWEIELMLTQDRCTVCAERTIGSEIVLAHLMELLGDMGLVARFDPFGDSVGVIACCMV
jgi:hypothetical protein